MMKTAGWLLGVFLFSSCAKVLPVYKIPELTLGEPSFFPTIEAHTDAPIVGENRVDILLNGDETFPPMLRDIKLAKRSITFAQYLYEDGSIAYELAKAFAERCRAGVRQHPFRQPWNQYARRDTRDHARCRLSGGVVPQGRSAAGTLRLEAAEIQLSQPSAYSRN